MKIIATISNFDLSIISTKLMFLIKLTISLANSSVCYFNKFYICFLFKLVIF